jgi:hypothetical protein
MHQLLVYADDVNILGGSIHAIKTKAEALVVTTYELGLDVNTEETKLWSCLMDVLRDKVTI